MKNHILAVAVLLLCSFIPGVSKAQSVAHLNYQEIVQLMPEYQKASLEYETYKVSLDDQLKEIENKYLSSQKKADEESKKPTPSQIKLKVYYQQMEAAQLEFQEMQGAVQDSLNAKMAELLQPIRDKVSEAVAQVAKEKGYTHVLDNTNSSLSGTMLVYADPTHDITAAVKTKLGLKEKPQANPGAGKPKPIGTGK